MRTQDKRRTIVDLVTMLDDRIEVIAQTMNEGNNEVWLTSAQLSEQFGFATREWLKAHGERLPRQLVFGRWSYPRNKIQRMLREGKFN